MFCQFLEKFEKSKKLSLWTSWKNIHRTCEPLIYSMSTWTAKCWIRYYIMYYLLGYFYDTCKALTYSCRTIYYEQDELRMGRVAIETSCELEDELEVMRDLIIFISHCTYSLPLNTYLHYTFSQKVSVMDDLVMVPNSILLLFFVIRFVQLFSILARSLSWICYLD